MGEFPTGYQYGRPVPVVIENQGTIAAAATPMAGAETLIQQGNQQQQTAGAIDQFGLSIEKAQAQDALNRLRVAKDDLTWGEKNGFMNMKAGDVLQKTGDGQAPMVSYTERLAAVSSDVSRNLTGRARKMYDDKAVGEIEGYRAGLLQYTMQQTEVFQKNVFAGAMKQIETESVRFAGDPQALDGLAVRASVAATNWAKSQGLEPGPLVAEVQSNVYKNAITGMLVRGDSGALQAFERYKDKLDAKDRLGLEQSIKTLAIGTAAQSWVAGASGGPTTEQARAGTKASMEFWQQPNARGEKFDNKVAAGITAGFLRESQFFTGAVNPRDGRDGSDSINIGQWNGSRAKAFQEFARAKGLDPNDVKTGMLYARAEIDGEIPQSISGVSPDLKTKLANAKSEKEAADLMTRFYFKPLHTEGESAIRQRSASAILQTHGGVQVAQGDGEPVDARTGQPVEQGSNDAPAGGPPPKALASDGIVDARRMMIDVEKQRLDLLAKARAEFGGNLPMLQATNHQIEAQYQVRKAEVQLYKDQIYAGVQDWMTKGGPNGGPATSLPPPTIFSQLTWEQQQSIERQVERNIAGKKTVTRQDVWYTIQQGLTSANANERETWATAPLMQFKEFLSDQDFQELAKMQAGVRKGEGKEITAAQTVGQMINSTLMGMGIDPTPKPGSSQTAADSDTMKAAKFHRVFQSELTTLEETKGKKATPLEIQGILDGMVKTVATSGKSFWGGVVEKPIALLTPADVPAADRQQIIAEIRRRGGVPTDERVLQVYQNEQIKRPTQNEIPRPLEMPALGIGGQGGAPRETQGAGSGPVSGQFPARRGAPVEPQPLMRRDDYSPRPAPGAPIPRTSGPQSRPEAGYEISPNDAAHERLRRMLGL